MAMTLTSIRTHARRVQLGPLLPDAAWVAADRRRAASTDHEIHASVLDR